MTKMISTVYKEGGATALFRGLGPQLMAAVPATCGMYAGERFFNRLFQKPDGSTDVTRIWLAGSCSGITETLSVCPFEVIKVRLQSKAQHLSQYKNTLHAIGTVLKQEGPIALYSGALPLMYRNGTFNGLFFTGCFLIRENVAPQPSSAMESFMVDFVSGTIMGALATPAKMPFFVVKTRKQAGGDKYLNGTFATMRAITKEEGARALWNGTLPAMVRMSLGGAVCLSSFRLFSSLLEG
ncbi:hypothetical protein TrST_g12326 [Triparma strigata]|uniref:Mitochondrial carrier protein n=1 Tax=Triparma strigata TaxID=1606541 RepID=A0A9W7B6F6_9STRA|nr:hypothetical protein TrST_g12326 [Triparma strigata]